MEKLYPDAAAALDDVLEDGMIIASGGFGLCGIPERLLDAIRDSGVGDLTFCSNNAGIDNEGIGKLLCKGVKVASEEIGRGSEDFAIHAGGQELPMHEPRMKVALGVGYAVAPVGADHCMSMHDTAFEYAGSELDRVNTALPEEDHIGPISPIIFNEDKMRLMQIEVNWKHFQCWINSKYT